MRIFVTGGTGYIGGALCRRWAAEGHEVRALVRATSDRRELESLGIECFVGDVSDRESMRRPMSRAEWVVHAAAELDFGAPRERMKEANAVGSENVASLALETEVERVLHISSIAAFGGSAPDGTPSNEQSTPLLPFPNNYCITKRTGEDAFRRLTDDGLALNVVYPSLVYGPPSKKGGINSFLRLMLTGRLPAVVGADRISTWIYLDDLVEGIVGVMETSRPGEHYLLAGESASTKEVVSKVCNLGHVRPPRFEIPVPLARLLLVGLMPIEVLSGRRMPFNLEQLRTLSRHWNFDDRRARRDLAWSPRTLDEGLPPTVEFLQQTITMSSRA
jgi:nucleoside-diphosphate-sugar epimerase